MNAFPLSPITIAVLLLSALTLLIYGQTVNHAFIAGWDDYQYIIDNPFVSQGLTSDGIVRAFSSFHYSNWHPLTWVSHMLDYELYGENPSGHFISNMVLHLANSLLLFFVLFRLTRAYPQSLLVACLFCVHPLHVESVAWISERKDVLSMFFWLASLLSYVEYVKKPASIPYILSVLFFACAMMSKQMVVTLPFVLLLLDVWPLQRLDKISPGGASQVHSKSFIYLLWEKAPLFALSIVGSVVVIFAQGSGGSIQTAQVFPLDMRLANALSSYACYLWKTALPVNLAFLYPYNTVSVWFAVLSAIGFIAITLIAVKLYKTRPYLIIGWLWYLGTLVPVIGLLQVGVQPMADRYTYIPLIGIFIMLAWGLNSGLQKISVISVVSIIIVLLSILSFQQTRVWANGINLYRHATQVTINNDRAYALLAEEYERSGLFEDSIREAKNAIKLNPKRRIAYNTIGQSLRQLGRPEEATKYFKAVLDIHPDYSVARYNLGNTYLDLGMYTQAITELQQVLQSTAVVDNVALHTSLGIALQYLQKPNQAAQHYRIAIQINPRSFEPRFNLALLLEKQNKTEEAVEHFSQLLDTDADHVGTLNHLTFNLIRLNLRAEAEEHNQHALMLEPHNKNAIHLRSAIEEITDNNNSTTPR